MKLDRHLPRRLAALILTTSLGFLAGCSAIDGTCGCVAEPSCKVQTTAPVAWTETTSLGSPEAAFSSFSGTCQAPFQWDAGDGPELTASPPRGQSTMTVTVTMDQASARLVNFDYCPDTLSADGTITLELPDAMVADRRPVTLSASADSVPTRVTFGLDEKDFGPWLSVTKADPQSSLRMTVGVTAPERGCSGDIQLIWTQVRGNVGAAAGRPLATWSDTGCGTGQSAVPLDQAWQGIDLVRAVVTTFGHVDVPGTWRDGSATTLSLVTSMLGNVGCAEPAANGFSVVTIPVDVAASTADGRVRGLAGKGSIRAEVSGGALWQLQLALRSASVCASQGDSLPYTPASCVTGRRATGQLNLGVNRSDAARSWGSLDFNLWQGNTSEGWDGLTLQP